MFEHLATVAKDIHTDILEIYWILLVPVVILLIILEIVRGTGDIYSILDIFRRIVVSIILIFTFEQTAYIISKVGDGIVSKIDATASVWDAFKNINPETKELSYDFFSLRGHILYLFAVTAYFVAYLGFFVAQALIHFIWVILFAVSPLMILAYIPKATANITANLYKGLVKVTIWRILWTLLGVLFLKTLMAPHVGGAGDYVLSIVVNLCIGLSMLFIPFMARSLINDGLESAASAFALAPTIMAGSAAKLYATRFMKQRAVRAFSMGRSAFKSFSGFGTRMRDFRKKESPDPSMDGEKTAQWDVTQTPELLRKGYGLSSENNHHNKAKRYPVKRTQLLLPGPKKKGQDPQD